MTTSNIDELLKRETYQGMSDAEIQTIIDFHVESASASKAIADMQAKNDAALDALIELSQRKLELMEAAHEAALEAKPRLENSSPILEAH